MWSIAAALLFPASLWIVALLPRITARSLNRNALMKQHSAAWWDRHTGVLPRDQETDRLLTWLHLAAESSESISPYRLWSFDRALRRENLDPPKSFPTSNNEVIATYYRHSRDLLVRSTLTNTWHGVALFAWLWAAAVVSGARRRALRVVDGHSVTIRNAGLASDDGVIAAMTCEPSNFAIAA